MKVDEIYRLWKDRAGQVKVPSDFADGVMSRIYRYEAQRTTPVWDLQWLLDWLADQPLVKAILVTVGAMGGLLRIAFVAYALLYC
jgi:hypothetical protein